MKLEQKVLAGDELFEFDGMPQPVSVSDFWAWSMSRLIADGPRGDLAEFIVRMALGESVTIPKRGWGEYDVGYRGIGVEVKCSSLIQEWERDRPSKPVFSIRPTYASDIGECEDGSYRYVGRTDSELRRRSDVYVFCLFANPDRSTANPLKLDQWEFYVAATKQIDEQLGDRRSASIKTLEKLGVAKCDFYGIQREVDGVVQFTQGFYPPPPEIDVSVNFTEGTRKERKGVSVLAFFFFLQRITLLFGVSMARFWRGLIEVPENQGTQLSEGGLHVFVNRAYINRFSIGELLRALLDFVDIHGFNDSVPAGILRL